jgi:hypothetical protein
VPRWPPSGTARRKCRSRSLANEARMAGASAGDGDGTCTTSDGSLELTFPGNGVGKSVAAPTGRGALRLSTKGVFAFGARNERRRSPWRRPVRPVRSAHPGRTQVRPHADLGLPGRPGHVRLAPLPAGPAGGRPTRRGRPHQGRPRPGPPDQSKNSTMASMYARFRREFAPGFAGYTHPVWQI